MTRKWRNIIAFSLRRIKRRYKAFTHSLVWSCIFYEIFVFSCWILGIKCPVCSKFVPSEEVEIHLVMCLTKPQLSYNGKFLPFSFSLLIYYGRISRNYFAFWKDVLLTQRISLTCAPVWFGYMFWHAINFCFNCFCQEEISTFETQAIRYRLKFSKKLEIEL